MIEFIKKLFGSKPAEVTQPEAVPYKVEALVDTADIAIAQLPTPIAEKATEAVVKSVAKSAPKKSAAVKKPRAPRKPKAV
jgi:hypothetical protein